MELHWAYRNYTQKLTGANAEKEQMSILKKQKNKSIHVVNAPRNAWLLMSVATDGDNIMLEADYLV
jgi:hypothetical protein